MRVGLVTVDPASAVSDARAAEDLGFDLLACGEHLFFHRAAPSPFIQLAAAAGVTERIRLVSSITLLPLYPAALVAKLAATLDQVSNGRFELGLGAGGEYPPEFHAAGVEPSTRFRRLDEGLAVVRGLFTGTSTRFEGEFASIADLALVPPPVQAGGPPIWLAGRRDRAIRRAGRFADVWLPYLVTPELLRTGLGKVRVAAADAGRHPEEVRGAVFAWTCVDRDAQWARRAGIAAVSAAYQQDFEPLADRYLVLGDPDAVVSRLRAFADAGADSILIQLAVAPDQRARVLTTVAEHVLPKLAAAEMSTGIPNSFPG